METIYYSGIPSRLLKNVFVASTEKGLCMVDYATTEKNFLKKLKERFRGRAIRDNRSNREILSQLKGYLEGRLMRFDCLLDLRGTSFQKKVWRALVKIPYGQTRSYKDVAKAIGHPKAFRAVGNANGSNAIPLVVPCHRVIESNGGLGGFGHGIRFKKRLLDLERARGRRARGQRAHGL